MRRVPQTRARMRHAPLPRHAPRRSVRVGRRRPLKPQDVLLTLVHAGVLLGVEGGRLRFRAAAGAVTEELRAQIASCRVAVVALVRASAVLPVRVSDWPEESVHEFEERAGILEFDAGMDRVLAELEAERLVRAAFTRAFIFKILPRSSP